MSDFKDSMSLFGDELFDDPDSVLSTPDDEKGIILNERYGDQKDSLKRKMRILNKHLLPSETPREGLFQLPKVLPFVGDVPDVFIPYSAKVCYNSEFKGVYCHIDDCGFNTTWTRPIPALRKVQHYMVAVAPDNTLRVDGNICENIEQIRKALNHMHLMALLKTVGQQLAINELATNANNDCSDMVSQHWSKRRNLVDS